MGFLELDKVHTIELFLTDKGKELMLRENGKGLYDLISQFSLDDRDYDYRRTSSVWIDGVSPVPSGYPLDPQFGTTQGLINDDGLGAPNNSCANSIESKDCWFDMPDVRGDRGQKIIHCNYMTASTESIIACTNIYVFYDVTSTQATDAVAAKIGLTEWYAGITASTPNFTGKIFHIPVYGEAWINTSYYPWNGKLDTWDYASPANSGCANDQPRFCGDSNISGTWQIACNAVGYSPQVSWTDVDGGTITVNKYPKPVTGLYLQNDGDGVGTGDWGPLGFNIPELPPGAGQYTGSRAEFWTTGCTLNTLGGKDDPTRTHPYSYTIDETIITVGFTATTGSVTWDANALDPYPLLSGTTLEEVFNCVGTIPALTCGTMLMAALANGFTEPPYLFQSFQGWEQFNLCEGNCCPDPGYTGPGLFGCQDCSPFDNTITDGKGYQLISQTFTATTGGVGYSAGTSTIKILTKNIPCETYRGMDRNVLIINVFDEADSSQRFSNGGFNMLGPKVFYDTTSTDPINNTYPNLLPTTNAPGTNPYLGQLGACKPANTNAIFNTTWGDRQWMGFHGMGRGETSNAFSCSDNCQVPPQGTSNDWNQWSFGVDGSCGATNAAIRNPQPTVGWLYSQDLFHKSYAFYNSFRGFVYPVLANQSSAAMTFLLHLYGVVYGTPITPAELAAKGTNPTIASTPGASLNAITTSNPYSAITSVFYPTPTPGHQHWYEPGSTTEPFDPSQLGPGGGQNLWYNVTHGPIAGVAQGNSNPIRGLKNFGWDFNPTVGCTFGTPAEIIAAHPGFSSWSGLNCLNKPGRVVCGDAATTGGTVGNIFSGGTFVSDLNKFLSGSTFQTTVVTTGCTECQCLPTVFLDIKGPILMTPDPNAGCLCPDGTYSPECCTTYTSTGEALCGPAPLSSEVLISGDHPLVSDGTITPTEGKSASYRVAKPTSSFTSGLQAPTANLESLEPSSLANALSSKYTTDYSVGFIMIFHNYLNQQGKVEFDMELKSIGRYAGSIITERDGGGFYWMVQSGYGHQIGNSKVTKPCIPPTKTIVNHNKSQYIGGATSYVRAHSALGKEFMTTVENMDHYQICISLAMSIHNKMFFASHRYEVVGDDEYGYKVKQLS